MKRSVLCFLLCMLLMIGGVAYAESIFGPIIIQEHDGVTADMGGYVFVSDWLNEKSSVDGYAIIQNVSAQAISCYEAKFALCDGQEIVQIVDVTLTQPNTVPSGGIMMFVISDIVDSLELLEDPRFVLVYNVKTTETTKQYIRMQAQIVDYESIDAKRIVMDTQKLPEGRYEAILLALDAEGYLVFAENKDFDTENGTEISASIEDRELRLMRTAGLEPVIGAAVVYQK